MQQKLQMVEFGVSGLEEMRTLVKRWKQVLAELTREEDEGPSMVWQTRRQVDIEVEDRRPGGGGAPHLPGPQGGAGEVPGRSPAGGAGGLRGTADTRGGHHLPAQAA